MILLTSDKAYQNIDYLAPTEIKSYYYPNNIKSPYITKGTGIFHLALDFVMSYFSDNVRANNPLNA